MTVKTNFWTVHRIASRVLFGAILVAFPAWGAFGATLTVTSPNGGNIWEQGQQRAITWTHSGVTGGILIQPYINGVPQAPLTTDTPNDGYFLWTIPSNYTASAYVKIGISAMSGSVSDFSDSYFTIRPPALTVTDPDGGETLTIGQTYRLQWLNSGVYASIDIMLSRNGGTSWTMIESGLPGNYFYRDWVVTGPNSTNCRLKVLGNYQGGSREDISNSSFSIVSPALDVTWPNGGQTLYLGNPYTISWTSSGVTGTIAIDLYKGGSNLMRLAGGASNTGSFPFTPPWTLLPGSDYQIAVSAMGGTVYDFGGYFSIATPTITVLAPNGGEIWTAGSTQTIRWTSSQVVGNVLIQPYMDGIPQAPLTTGTTNDGIFTWNIPAEFAPSSCYTMGISAMDGHVSDFSNNCFRIESQPADLEIVNPNGGEILYAGHDFTATWTSANLTQLVKLELYKGNSMVVQFEAGTANDGSQVCALPANLSEGSDYRLAMAAESGDPYDFSDGYFTINRPSLNLTSPISGTTYMQGDQVIISWGSDHVLGDVMIQVFLDGLAYQVLAAGTPNDGYHAWSIPPEFPDSGNVQIEISAMSGQVMSISGGFTIGNPALPDFPAAIFYSQRDPLWSDESMGGTCTIGDLGCAMTCVAMLLSWEDGDSKDPDPSELNTWLRANGGYDGSCNIYWNVADNYLGDIGLEYVDRLYFSADEWSQVDAWLDAGYKPLVEVRLTGFQHWVVVYDRVGPSGDPGSYPILDPWEMSFSPTHTLASFTQGGGQMLFGMTRYTGSFPRYQGRLDVTYPAGGETFVPGQGLTIAWTSDNVDGTIQIQPYRGDTPLTNINPAAPNTGSYAWAIPLDWPAGEDYRISLSAEGGSTYAFSGFFAVQAENPVMVATLAPHYQPIVIPPTGGGIYYDLAIENRSVRDVVADVFLQAVLPNGNVYPVQSKSSVTFHAGALIVRNAMSQSVPAGAPAGTYAYQLFVKNLDGSVLASDEFVFDKLAGGLGFEQESDWILTGWDDQASEGDAMAVADALLGAYPNPFNPTTTIAFELKGSDAVTLQIFDLSGRLVATLVDHQTLGSGRHDAQWRGQDFAGRPVASGTYFYCLESDGGLKEIRRMVLVR
ncbi:MAG: Ser-Thr-rich GPI-anchored membrane family protein [Candidatus Krumholzibacteriia bacterium]